MIEIRIDSLNNLRDLGGYLTSDGKKVKSGLIYRGIRLEGLTPKGISEFKGLGIKHVFDLRDPTQSGRSPDPEIEGAAYHLTPAEIFSNRELNFDMRDIPSISDEEARERIAIHEKHYITFTTNPTAIKTIFEYLLSQQAPIYFHCTAGKDRTGITAAVILAALGVPYSTIEQDYMQSAVGRAEHERETIQTLYGQKPSGEHGNLIDCYLTVKKPWIKLAWDVIEQCGGIEEYLYQKLGVDKAARQRLKDIYLEDV